MNSDEIKNLLALLKRCELTFRLWPNSSAANLRREELLEEIKKYDKRLSTFANGW